MKWQTMVLPAIVSALLLSSGAATGQPGPDQGQGPGKGERPHRMWAELNLNDKQKEELKKLHDEMQEVRKKHREAVKTVRDKMKAELLKKESSQNVLYGYAGELGELHKQMTKDRTDHLLKVKKVLTPEQFKKIVEKEGRRHKGPPKRKGDWQHRGDGPHGKGAPGRGGN